MKVSAVAKLLGLSVVGDPNVEITGVAPLDLATQRDISFLANAKYRETARRSSAGALLVPDGESIPGKVLIPCPDPYLAFALVMQAFHPPRAFTPGIHSTAIAGIDCTIDPSAHVGPYAVVGDGVTIGRRSVVEAACTIGNNCRIGEDCHVFPRVVLYPDTIIGDRVSLHSGAVVGADGFGYAQDESRHVKIPQVGRVVIESDVEIGANTTIDRGAMEETRIGEGTKVDNLVQIAHNVRMGPDCILVAQSGISGSTTLGRSVILAGQSGAVGHIRIGDRVRIGAKSAVTKSLPDDAFVTGHPAQPHKAWLKERAMAGRLEELLDRVKELERRLSELRAEEGNA